MIAENYEAKRESCREMFLAGRTVVRELADVLSVTPKTVRKWIREGGWRDELDELETLDAKIRLNIRRALLMALKQYADNPQDTALQSLVSLLKQYQKELEPSKDLIDHMKRFLDWQIVLSLRILENTILWRRSQYFNICMIKVIINQSYFVSHLK